MVERGRLGSNLLEGAGKGHDARRELGKVRLVSYSEKVPLM